MSDALVLAFPPRCSSTYVPLGAAVLAGYLDSFRLDGRLRIVDLNIATCDLAAAALPGAAAASDFFRKPSPDFFDETAYRAHSRVWSGVQATARRLADDARIYIETGEISAALDPWLNMCSGQIAPSSCRLLGLSVVFPEQLLPGLAIAKHLQTETGVKIVLGGAAMSAVRADQLLAACPFVDGVVPGEGEAPLLALAQGRAYDEVPGLIHRCDGGIRMNPVIVPVLRGAPLPQYDGLPIQLYTNPEPVLPLLTSRGCLWRRCRFCSHNASFAHYRRRPIRLVVDEMVSLQERYGCRHFYIADQYVDPQGLEDLSEELLAREFACSFHVMGRPEAGYTPLLLEKAFAAGCHWISWGVETGSERLLAVAGKGTSPAVIHQILSDAHRAGINNLLMMVFGLPTSTPADLEETFTFLERVYSYADAMTSSAFVLFDRTPFARRPDRYGLKIIGADRLFTANGVDVNSTRLKYRRSDETGAGASAVAATEVERWQKRRQWLGDPPFVEQLPAEHYLLFAAHKAAGRRGKPGRFFDPARPIRLPRAG